MKTRIFLIIKRDKDKRRYIAEVIHSDMYPSTKSAELGVNVIEIPNSGRCHIYLD